MVDSWLSAAAQEAMFQVEAMEPVKKTPQRGTWWEMCSCWGPKSLLLCSPQTPQWSLQAHFQGWREQEPAEHLSRHWWGRGGFLNPHKIQLLGGWWRNRSSGSSEVQTSSPRCEMCSGTMKVHVGASWGALTSKHRVLCLLGKLIWESSLGCPSAVWWPLGSDHGSAKLLLVQGVSPGFFVCFVCFYTSVKA